MLTDEVALLFFYYLKLRRNYIMKLKDTGLTVQDIKDKVSKYMIETYERFDFLAETAEGMYLYDEKGTPYLDFYAGIAVNNAGSRNPKVVATVKTSCIHSTIHIQFLRHYLLRKFVRQSEWTRSSTRTPVPKQTRL